MSLTKEAIQLITDTALIADGKELNTITPTIVLPEATKIVNLEQFGAGRSRFRGTFSTNSLTDFAKYVSDRAVADAKGFINQDEMTCSVLFNLGNEEVPGHADDRAVLKLKPTAAYQAVQAISGKAMSQKDMSDWIEDWHGTLSAVGDELQNIPLAKAIAAVRTITVGIFGKRSHRQRDTRQPQRNGLHRGDQQGNLAHVADLLGRSV